MDQHFRAPGETGGTPTDLGGVLDRACRHVVEGVPAETWRNALCEGIASVLGVRMAALVRRAEGGAIDMVATSSENRLWAEFARLPERWDGTIAGNGPSAQALREADRVIQSVSDEGFRPWRDVARMEDVAWICAQPLERDDPWALLLFGDRSADFDRDPLRHRVLAAAAGCTRVLDAQDRLAREQLLSDALTHSGNAAFVADLEGRMQWCNAAFTRLTGYAPEEVLGRTPQILASGRHGPRHYRDLWNTIRRGRTWHRETVDRHKDGHTFTVLQTITPIGAADRISHYVAIYEDISQQKEEERQRELRGAVDPLTALAHLSALRCSMEQALAAQQPLGVGVLAVRKPPAIAGLEATVQEAWMAEIRSRIAERLGAGRAAQAAPGDFLLWLPADRAEATGVAQHLHAALTDPSIQVPGVPPPEVRIGIACAPADGTALDPLVHRADRANGIEPLEPARRWKRRPATDDGRVT